MNLRPQQDGACEMQISVSRLEGQTTVAMAVVTYHLGNFKYIESNLFYSSVLLIFAFPFGIEVLLYFKQHA
jgi:hypothetical protein